MLSDNINAKIIQKLKDFNQTNLEQDLMSGQLMRGLLLNFDYEDSVAFSDVGSVVQISPDVPFSLYSDNDYIINNLVSLLLREMYKHVNDVGKGRLVYIANDSISCLSNNDIINNTYNYRIDLRVNYFFWNYLHYCIIVL